MLPVACYLYDDFALRWRDGSAGEWRDYGDVLWMKEHALRAICDLFISAPHEVIAVADGVRVVNSDRLVAECKRRGIPVRTFALIREVAEVEGILDRRFYSVGFGPGLTSRYS